MSGVVVAVLAGLSMCLALIVAIGAQNAFILRHGIRGQVVLPVVAIAIGSDAILMGIGIGGVGTIVGTWPGVVRVISWVGAVFLIGYGLRAGLRAFRPGRLEVTAATGSVRTAVLTCLAVTWLNPHTYLDTVLLVGSVANSYGSARWLFGVGALLASTLWFSALGFGARLLRGLFARPVAWRILDAMIATVMVSLGVGLIPV